MESIAIVAGIIVLIGMVGWLLAEFSHPSDPYQGDSPAHMKVEGRVHLRLDSRPTVKQYAMPEGTGTDADRAALEIINEQAREAGDLGQPGRPELVEEDTR